MAPREDVAFPSGDGTCAAWLYRGDGGPQPVVVLAHGLAGVREMRLDAFAERFAAAGYACLVFDYRHFGASSGEPRQLLDIGRQREDWRAAVAYARSRPELDPDRVVVWGTSFGGGHAIVTAANDPRVAAAIAQNPFTDGPASTLALPPLVGARLTARAVADLVAARARRPPVMVPAAGRPGSTALMVAPDALPGVEALQPAEGSRYREDVCARFGLQIVRDRPGRRLRDVTCPILLTVCERDSVAPAKATLRHARRAPRAEVRTYPVGHFDVYVGDAFETVVADQVAFLERHVPV